MPAAELRPDVGSYVVDARVVAVGAGDYGLRHGYNVALAEGEALLLRLGKHGIHRYFDYVVALPDYGGADAS